MIVIGIDPGVHGAVAALNAGITVVEDIPTFETHKGKRKRTEYDCAACYGLLLRLSALAPVNCIYLEDARGRAHGRSDGANCPKCGNPLRQERDSLLVVRRAGESVGMWRTAAAVLKLRIEIVQPASWKRAMGLLGRDKEASRYLACQKFPALASQLARKKDHNRAEAMLIAEYGRRRHIS